MKNLTKKITCSIMTAVLILCIIYSAVAAVIPALTEADTPIADIPNDTYVPYIESYKNIPSSYTNGLDVEIYDSEKNYLHSRNNNIVYEQIINKIEPVKMTLRVLDMLTKKPIANAITRLNGVPRFTDRNGEVNVTLNKLIYELYIIKNTLSKTESYNPHMEFIFLEDYEENFVKTVYLQRPSDDICFEYAMFDNCGTIGNVLLQDSYFTLNDDYSYADLNIKTNVNADEYRLYCDDELIYNQENGHFPYLELEEFCHIGSKLSVQVVYQGIESKIVDLNIYILKQIEQNDICDPDRISIDLNIDGNNTSRSNDEKPGFFGAFRLDLQDLMKNLFSIIDEKNSMALNFSIDPRTGNLKAIIGYELERKSNGRDRLVNKLNSLGNDKDKKVERDKIKREIKAIDNRDYKVFGNTYNDIKKTLQKKQKGVDEKARQRKVIDQIKRIKDIKPKVKQGGLPHFSNAPKFQLNVDVVGAFEFNIPTMQFVDISLMVMCEGKVQFGGEFVVVYVPCFWRIDIGLDAEFKITLMTRKDETAIFKLEDFLNFTMEIYAKGEIGAGFCDLLSVSGYIRLGLKMDWTIISKEIDLNGTFLAGVKLKALLWDFYWDIYDKEWRITGNSPNEQGVGNISTMADTKFSNNMYEASKPILTNYKGKLVLTWVEYSSERDLFNNTVLKYSLLENGNWTAPKAVFDSGCADFDYDIYNDNDQALYITWQNASKKFDASSDISDMSKATEIYFAQFDEEKHVFSKIEKLTDDNDMDAQPVFAKKEKSEDSITVLWRKNSENNILGFNGRNYFVQSILKNGIWTTSELVADFNTPVSNGVAAYKNGVLNTAFVVDVDGDLLTNDREIVLAKNGALFNITNSPSEYSAPSFIKDKSKYVLSYRDKNELKSYHDDINAFETCAAEINCLDTVKFVEDNVNGRKILYYTKLIEDVKQLYCSIYDFKTALWSDEVCLTNEINNVVEPSIAITDSGLLSMAYYLYDESTGIMSLCYAERELNHRIQIENVYLEEMVKTGVDFGIRFEVINNGDLPISQLTAEIIDQSFNISMDKPLLPNERKYYQLHYIVNDSDTKSLELKVSAKNGDNTIAQDIYILPINYVDYGLQVEKEIINGKQIFSITANCLSERSGLTTLVIYRGGNEVYRSLIDTRDAACIKYCFDELSINDLLKFELITADNDFDLTNNAAFLHSTIEEKKATDDTQWKKYKKILEMAKGFALWG